MRRNYGYCSCCVCVCSLCRKMLMGFEMRVFHTTTPSSICKMFERALQCCLRNRFVFRSCWCFWLFIYPPCPLLFSLIYSFALLLLNFWKHLVFFISSFIFFNYIAEHGIPQIKSTLTESSTVILQSKRHHLLFSLSMLNNNVQRIIHVCKCEEHKTRRSCVPTD